MIKTKIAATKWGSRTTDRSWGAPNQLRPVVSFRENEVQTKEIFHLFIKERMLQSKCEKTDFDLFWSSTGF